MPPHVRSSTLQLPHCPQPRTGLSRCASARGSCACLLELTRQRAMSDQAAATGSGGSNQPASRHRGGGGGSAAAAAEAGLPGALQQESPPFVGLSSSGTAVRPWRSTTDIDSKQHQLKLCATRTEAAAHDLALIWKRAHGKGGCIYARGLACA